MTEPATATYAYDGTRNAVVVVLQAERDPVVHAPADEHLARILATQPEPLRNALIELFDALDIQP